MLEMEKKIVVYFLKKRDISNNVFPVDSECFKLFWMQIVNKGANPKKIRFPPYEFIMLCTHYKRAEIVLDKGFTGKCQSVLHMYTQTVNTYRKIPTIIQIMWN